MERARLRLAHATERARLRLAVKRSAVPSLTSSPLTAVLLVLLGWTVISAPLLIRNIRRYGWPTYNVNSSLLFVDEYSDPVRLARTGSLASVARTYWDEHSMAAVVARELRGLVWESFIILRTLGPAPMDDGRVVFGVCVLGAALIGLLATRRTDRTLVVTWLVLFWLVFAWYVPIAAGDRFVLPLIVPLTAYASVGMLRGLRVVWKTDSSRFVPLAVAPACLLWCLLIVLFSLIAEVPS